MVRFHAAIVLKSATEYDGGSDRLVAIVPSGRYILNANHEWETLCRQPGMLDHLRRDEINSVISNEHTGQQLQLPDIMHHFFLRARSRRAYWSDDERDCGRNTAENRGLLSKTMDRLGAPNMARIGRFSQPLPIRLRFCFLQYSNHIMHPCRTRHSRIYIIIGHMSESGCWQDTSDNPQSCLLNTSPPLSDTSSLIKLTNMSSLVSFIVVKRRLVIILTFTY